MLSGVKGKESYCLMGRASVCREEKSSVDGDDDGVTR